MQTTTPSIARSLFACLFAATHATAQPVTLDRPLYTLLPTEQPFTAGYGDDVGLHLHLNDDHTLLAHQSPRYLGPVDPGTPSTLATFDARTGRQTQSFRIPRTDGTSTWFGQNAIIDGNRVITTAPSVGDPNDLSDTGGTYVLNLDNAQIEAFIDPEPAIDPDSDEDNRFFNQAFAGNTVVMSNISGYSSVDTARVLIFDTDTAQLRADLGHFVVGARRSARLATDGNHIAVLHKSGRTAVLATLFDAQGNPLRTLNITGYTDISYYDIAIEGDHFVVGSRGSRVDNIWVGAAYVYSISTGQLLHTLRPPALDQRTELGTNIAIRGNTVAATAPGYRDADNNITGAVYLFDISTGQLTNQYTYTPTPFENGFIPTHLFGTQVALNDHHVAVSIDHEEVVVFDRDDANPPRFLTSHNRTYQDNFGRALAVSGNTLIVTNSESSDVSDVYTFDLTTGQQTGELVPSTFGYILRNFGHDADADTNTAIVTDAGLLTNKAGGNEGVARIFDLATGQQIDEIRSLSLTGYSHFGIATAIDQGRFAIAEIPGPSDGFQWTFSLDPKVAIYNQHRVRTDIIRPPTNLGLSLFGYALDQHHTRTLIGDPGLNEAVYLYDATDRSLTQLDNPFPGDRRRAGHAVQMNDHLIAIAAPEDSRQATRAGAVDLYDATTLTYLETITATTPVPTARFGFNLALSDRYLAVASPEQAAPIQNPGAVHVYDTATRDLIATLLPPDAATTQGFGSDVSIQGNLVIVAADRADLQGTDSGAVFVYNLCPADVNADTVLDNGDIGAFVALFLTGDPAVDFNGDLILDNGDIAAFVQAFLAGC